MPKTSLQKSHSKWSNFKLTSLSVLASFFSCAIWIVLIFKENIKNEYLFYIPLIQWQCFLNLRGNYEL